MSSPNPELRGETLLIITPWAPTVAFLAKTRQDHPGLAIVHKKLSSWRELDLPSDMSEADWATVTVLLTMEIVPPPHLVPNLKYVQLVTAGCNSVVDKPLFAESNVALCTANGVHPPQIAEWVACTFLAHQHHLLEYLDAMRDGNWIASETDEDVEDVVRMRVGIFGYGSIGRQIARVCNAMGMEVIAYTRSPRLTPESRRDDGYTEPGLGDPEGSFPSAWFSGSDTASVNEFLAQDLDLLVLAMPLTRETRNVIAAPQFEILSKKRTYVSNIGRGGLIKTDDLIHALDRGLIRGAALDVTEPEPLPRDHPLWHKKNVIVTPHVSGNSHKYNDRVLDLLQFNLKRMSEGGKLINVVDPKKGY
ncbi:D-3-phosphoglycerate dehydrogenase [Xylariales sp. PMI_506]|nr:D-3-phosphoglycerate dehydrogenase [Xylariales sp. PMI_506]